MSEEFFTETQGQMAQHKTAVIELSPELTPIPC